MGYADYMNRCNLASQMAGLDDGRWNTRYRDALMSLGLKLRTFDQKFEVLPRFPDSIPGGPGWIPMHAPKPSDSKDAYPWPSIILPQEYD